MRNKELSLEHHRTMHSNQVEILRVRVKILKDIITDFEKNIQNLSGELGSLNYQIKQKMEQNLTEEEEGYEEDKQQSEEKGLDEI